MHLENVCHVSALIDLDTIGNLIDCTLAAKLQLPLQPLQHLLHVQALDSGPIGGGSINPPSGSPRCKPTTHRFYGDHMLVSVFSRKVPQSTSSLSLHHLQTIESPETPPEYHKFKEAFKAKASGLPPHQPYDYIIKLLAGSTPTRNHIYPSSAKETQAVNEYIEEVLQQGYIHPSTSSPSTTYVFVEKIQGGLRPLVPSAL